MPTLGQGQRERQPNMTSTPDNSNLQKFLSLRLCLGNLQLGWPSKAPTVEEKWMALERKAAIPRVRASNEDRIA